MHFDIVLTYFNKKENLENNSVLTPLGYVKQIPKVFKTLYVNIVQYLNVDFEGFFSNVSKKPL